MTVTVALCVAVAPLALVATRVKVVVAEIGTVVDPLSGTVLPLIRALAALVVDQVTSAVVGFCKLAVICAVGAAAGGVTVTVALWVAVAPLALRATSVNVVVADTGIVVDPLRPTGAPLMVAVVALVVDQVIKAVVGFCRVAVICAVGGAGSTRLTVTSFDGAPT